MEDVINHSHKKGAHLIFECQEKHSNDAKPTADYIWKIERSWNCI